MKKQIISLALISSLALCGCGTQNNSASSDGYTPQTETYTEPAIVYDYYCAVDLVGKAIADIEASGFNCSIIYNLTEYDYETASDYTVLVDGTYAFASGVLCKGDAVIASDIPTTLTLDELDPNIDLNEDIYWSAATDTVYTQRLLTMADGEEFNLNFYWRTATPYDIFKVLQTSQSEFAFVYQNQYVYNPDYDFMWFNWGDSIYDVESSLISKGFQVSYSEYTNNTLLTESVSETLYGKNFYEEIYYNDNMQLTGGQYVIYGTPNEIWSIYYDALNDIVAKYGDSYQIQLGENYTCVNDILTYLHNTTDDGLYRNLIQLDWYINGHTRIKYTVNTDYIEIEYRSIESTGGTGMNEDSLI